MNLLLLKKVRITVGQTEPPLMRPALLSLRLPGGDCGGGAGWPVGRSRNLSPAVGGVEGPSLELSLVEAVVVPAAARVAAVVDARVVGAAAAPAPPSSSAAGRRGRVLAALRRRARLLLSLVVLLALHPAVLEPDLDLALG